MFPPSTYCPYPMFPNSSSSSYPSFTTFLNPENASNSNNNNNNTFLHHDPLSSVPYTVLPTPNPAAETLTNWAVADHYAAMLKQDLATGGGAHFGGSSSSSISNLLNKKPAAANRKPAAKKDRHSKIHTSQGLRDRRVRLSIEIARKFFDLQDMLGFDKASNTLEWLFNKSKKAIEELTRSKQQHSSSAAADDHSFSSDSSSEGEVYYSKDHHFIDDIVPLERVDSDERKLKRAQKKEQPVVCVQAKMKESREKARARARERTSGKEKEKYPATTIADENPHQIFHQLSRHGGGGEDSTAKGEMQRDDIFNFIEESIVIKRKLKKSSVSSSSQHHHQNTLIPKEASYHDNSDCHSSPMSPNWDANNAAASNICTISSMNLSAGLQIFGKSWGEECTSPNRY